MSEAKHLFINNIGDRCFVKSPYNDWFVIGAKKLAGKFDRTLEQWSFPASQQTRVLDLCREIYGSDGTTEIPTVTLRLKLHSPDRWEAGVQAVICGRRVARVFGRDSGARLADNVVVLSGGFISGGSRKNPCIAVEDNTVIELLNVPRPVAEKTVASGGPWVETAAIVEEEDVLKAEREALIARLGEIIKEGDRLGINVGDILASMRKDKG